MPMIRCILTKRDASAQFKPVGEVLVGLDSPAAGLIEAIPVEASPPGTTLDSET
jgi:hypothetical protein